MIKTTLNKIAGAVVVGAAVFTAGIANAEVCDLNAERTCTINGAIFTLDFTQPAGTGVIDPFLTIQNNGTEQGYNTSGKPAPFDVKRQPNFTRNIQIQDLNNSVTTIGGVQYYSFLLDINEPNNSSSLISLDMLKIYTSQTGSQTTTNVDSLGQLRYNLDFPTDSYIKYDDRNSGSGQADIAFFVPVSYFAGALPTDYVYLYAMFGGNISAELTSQGGFEEFAIGQGLTVIPEVPAALPLGLVVIGIVGANYYRQRRAQA